MAESAARVLARTITPAAFARTGVGRRAIEAFERRVLERMPGFALRRSVVRRVSGSSDDDQFQPVLVEIEEALTPGFIVAEIGDDRFVVLVPSVPTPAAGSLYTSCRASACTGSTHPSPRRSP